MRISARSFLLGNCVGLLLLLIFWVFQFQFTAQADTTHIVISQVQVSGVGSGNADQEFVELYNPTGNTVDLTGWKLKDEKKSGATTSANLIASMSGSIAPHGYFLIASPSYSETVAADLIYSASSSAITSDNTVLLFDATGTNLVDEVGMGLAQDVETAAVSTPPPGGSILRKASSDSTAVTLTVGGSEANAGNGWDTDDNFTDFVVLATSFPRNSQSPQAPNITPVPTTPEPTVRLTPTPFATDTPTPTIEPTVTPTLTLEPTATVTSTPTPTEIPSNTPTQTISPTSTPMPTVISVPTEAVTPIATFTPVPTTTIVPTVTITPLPQFGFLQCTWKIKTLSLGFFQISFPILFCR